MTTTAAARPPLARIVVFFSLLRLVINIGIRMIEPFLPIMAAGMGVDLISISLAVSASNTTSIISPLLAPISERSGRKAGMLLGMVFVLLGLAAMVIWPSFPAFFLFLLLLNLGNNLLSPTTQAYLGDLIPFDKRGLAIAVNEMSWAASFILGMPVVGFLLDRSGWTSPFWMLAGAGLVLLIFLLRLPSDRPVSRPDGHFLSSLGVVFRSPSARAGLVIAGLLGCAIQIPALVFGVWIQSSFHLEAVALGVTSSVIGFSELGGEVAAAVLVDRLGKKRSMAASLVLYILSALLLPLFRGSYFSTLVWLVIFFLTFEFSAVAAMTLMTELLPGARATLMSSFFSIFSLGVAVGSILAPHLYRYGFTVNVLAGAGLNLIALALVFRIKLQPASSQFSIETS